MEQLLLALESFTSARKYKRQADKASTALKPASASFYFVFFLFIILISSSPWQKVSASHAAGGYVTYQWLYGNTYQFTVVFYRDCAGIAAPTEMEIDVNSSCGSGYVDAPQIPPSGTEIGYPCPNSTTCDGGTDPGFQEYIYQVDATFNYTCTDWIVSFVPSFADAQVLGRNSIITTLNPPLGDLYTQTTLDNVDYPTNDAVTFLNDPVLFACAGQPTTFNMGASDNDGDSLSYQLVTAMQGPGVPVSYVSPLSGQNPLFPGAGAVTLNSLTGDITINTSTLQVGVIDMLVNEYKNGVKVGSVILEIQVIVEACSNNNPTLSGINGTSVFTDSVCAGSLVNFNIFSNDVDVGQIVTMTWDNGIPLPAGYNVSGSPYPTGTFSWQTTAANARAQPYIFTVTIHDNSCPINGFESHSYSIYIIAPTITVSPVAPKICNGQSVSLTAGGRTTYAWSPLNGLSATTGSTVLANPSSTISYTVTGTDVNGCTNTSSVTVTVNQLPVITASPAAPSICNGQSVSLTAGGGTAYVWSPATGLSATTGTVVSANPSSITSYTVTGTNANGCSSTKSVTVTVNPLPVITASPAAPSICNGQSVSLTAGGGSTYAWSPSSGLSATTGTIVSANPSSTTSYTVTGTDANGCSNTKSVSVTVNPLPMITASPATPVLCNGQSVSLTAAGGTTYVWSPATGLSTTTGTVVLANPTSTTTYNVIGTDVNGCSNTNSVIVTVNPLPVITASPAAPVLCNGQSVSLTASGGSTYVWSPSTGLSATTGTVVSANPFSTTSYTVTGTDANGCSNTKSVTVTVNPLPVITASPVAPVLCNGQSVSLTAGGGTTYIWSPATGLSATTGTVVSANPSSTTSYTVTGTDANGCSNTKSVSVTVNPLPMITASPAAPVLCNGQSVSLTAGGGTAYVWSPATGLSTTTGTVVLANPTSTTTYNVIGTDVNGCSNTNSVIVTVNPLPVITASPAAPVLCNGQSVWLTAGGGTTYIWSPATGLSATTGTVVSANPSSTTSYTVTGTDANGCSNTKSVTVTVNPLPVITASPVAPVLCNGQSVSLTAGGGTTYIWSPATGLSATTGTIVSANPSSTTSYTVTGTDANGCSNTKSVTVTVNPLPVITASPAAPVLCNGQSVSLTAGGGSTYVWSPSTGLSATTGTVVSANPSSTTSYTVTGTDANGCSNTKSVTVTVNPLPVITASPVAPVLCNGQSVSLTAGGGSAYVWSPATGLSATTGTVVSANPSSTTSYTVTGTDANGCSNTKSVTVTVNPLPVITASPVAPVLCNGQSVSLTAGGGSTYVWSPAAGLSATTGTIVSANPSSTTSYTVTGTDANGCSNTKSVIVTVNPLPVITASPVAPVLCNGQSVSLTAGGGSTYVWSPSTGLSATTGTVVSANPSSTTSYTVTGTDANGCSNTKSVTVTVNPLPVITASPVAPVLCNGQSVSLTAGGGTTYIWSPATGLSATTGTVVSANPSSTTSYTVTGTDVNGCSNTKSVTVTVNPLPVITANPVAPVLCNGQSVSLTAGGGTAYVWSPATGLSTTTGTVVLANPTSTTTYNVIGTDVNGCSNTNSVIVTVNPLPLITASPAAPVLCNGQSVSLTAGGGTTYIWSPATGLSATTGTVVLANPTSTTTYNVIGTDVNGCSNTNSVTVTVNPLPVITANPVAPVLCNGQSVSLTAGGGSTYVWSPSTGLSPTTGTVVSANPSSTTSYTVTGTDANGCSNTKSVTVTVNPLPVITTSPVSPSICNGAAVTLTAGGGNTYVWSPGTGLSATTGTTVSASPVSTTFYTVTGTDANGCSDTTSVTVSVILNPVIVINPLAPILCNGQSATLTAGGGTTYVWSPSTGLSATTGTSVSANPSSTTTYTITGTIAGGCIGTTSVTVTVNPLPVITASPAAPVLCNGQSVSLSAGGGTTYVWSPSTGLSATTGTVVSANPSSTISYSVTGTDDNGCSNTKSVTVTVNPLPIITASPSAPVICSGESVSLTAGGGTSYVWSPSSGLSATTGTVVLANPSSTTSYTVTGMDGNGCSNTDSVTVTVNPLPVITASPAAPVLCNGQSVSLTAGGGTTYVWSPSTGLSATTGTVVSASPSSTTSYMVTGMDTNGCSNTNSVTVTVNPLPMITASPAAPVLCNGQSVSLTAGGGVIYLWSPSSGLSATTGTVVVANPSSTTSYTVTGTDTNGCSNTRSLTVTVKPLPLITASPANPVVCNGQSVSLTAGGGTAYVWSPATGLSATTGAIVSATPSSTTTYTVTGTNTSDCSNTASVTVIVNPLPVILASPKTPAICNGQSVLLFASGGNTYIWSPTKGLSSDTGATVSANPTTNTNYLVTGTDSNGCSNTSGIMVTVNQLPVVNAGPDANICNNSTAQINVTGAPPGSTYAWNPSAGLSCNNCSNPVASPTDTTNYIVLVTDTAGCSAQDTIVVFVTNFSFAAGPDTVICYGSSAQLYASGGTSYLWSPSSGLNSATIANPVATLYGAATYTVTISYGSCSATDTVSISVHPILPTPVITISSDTLFCQTNPLYKSYQWYFNNTPLLNDTNSYYVATQSGNYNVVLHDDIGCSISVGVAVVLSVGLHNLSGQSESLSIFPNPASSELFIQGYRIGENTTFSIYNMLGEKILEKSLPNEATLNDHTSIDLQNISAGIYFIEVQQRYNKWVGKFVKE